MRQGATTKNFSPTRMGWPGVFGFLHPIAFGRRERGSEARGGCGVIEKRFYEAVAFYHA